MVNLLLIDDRKELETLISFGSLNATKLITSKNSSLYDIAEKIKKTTLAGKWVLFVNIFLECSDKNFTYLQSNAGLALVKYLRLINVNHHIVIISPLSFEDLILKSPNNFIIASKGVSIVRRALDCYKYTDDKLNQLADKKFDGNLKPFIQAEFSLPEEGRHNWANWWGVKRLCDVHLRLNPDLRFKKHIENIENFEHYNESYPWSVNSNLRDLQCLQAVYLYNYSQESIDVDILKSLIVNCEKKIQELELKKQLLDNEFVLTTNWQKKPRSIVDFKSYYKELIKENVVTGRNENNSYLLSLIEEKEREEKQILSNVEKIETSINEHKNERSLLNSYKPKDFLKELIYNEELIFIKELNNRSPKILFIDDRANDGWAEIFQQMIYGQIQKESFRAVVPDPSNFSDHSSLKLFYNKFIKNPAKDSDLVLLDLRLKNEATISHAVENYSGALVLKMIREDFPGLPILMTTASNKVWTYEKLYQLGIDGYWIKEGLDLSSSLSSNERTRWSVNNYMKLYNLVLKFTGEEYNFLKSYSRKITELKKVSNPWWANKRWYNPDFQNRIKIVKKGEEFNCEVTDLLEYGLLLYREWLKIFILEDCKDSLKKSRLLANIINSLSGIIEIIHKKREYGKLKYCKNIEIGSRFDGEKSKFSRGDYLAFYLLEFRNRASHYFKNSDFMTWNFFKTFIKGMLTWLSVDYQDIYYQEVGFRKESERVKIKWVDKTLLEKKFEDLINSNKKLSEFYHSF